MGKANQKIILSVGVVTGIFCGSEAMTDNAAFLPSIRQCPDRAVGQRLTSAQLNLTSLPQPVRFLSNYPLMTRTHSAPAVFRGVVDSRGDIPADVCHALGWTNDKWKQHI